MTKVGEGETPQKPSLERYHEEIDQSSLKFINALETYKDASGEEQTRLRAIMDQQLGIIRSAVNELKRAGIYKQEVKVENDYKAYLSDGSTEHYAALEHDIATLREFNRLP